MNRLRHRIDITDDVAERAELLDAGARQLIQSRLYAKGYFSIATGYFVNLAECENLHYLEMMLTDKDSTIEKKVAARNRYKQLKNLDGQMVLIPDPFDEELLNYTETKTLDEITDDLEADAI